MKFSLLNVYRTNADGTVDGYWIQDHIGTIETAKEMARKTEAANSNKIQVAVVQQVPSPVAILDTWHNQKPIN